MAADSVVIRAAEGIEFTLSLAGPFSRMLAFLIDFSVILAAGSVLGYAVSILSVISPDLAEAALVVLYFAVSLLYGILTEWLWRGQTIGKRLLHLRVVDGNGLRLQASQVVVRNLLRAVDLLPGLYLIGGACCVLELAPSEVRRYRRGNHRHHAQTTRISPTSAKLLDANTTRLGSIATYPGGFGTRCRYRSRKPHWRQYCGATSSKPRRDSACSKSS